LTIVKGGPDEGVMLVSVTEACTSKELDAPWMAPSLAAMVTPVAACVMVVLKVVVPLLNVADAGTIVTGEDHSVGVPPYVVATLLYASYAVMVVEKAFPTSCGLEIVANTNLVAVPPPTLNALDEPIIAPSFAAIVTPLAACVMVALKVVTPFENAADPGAIVTSEDHNVGAPP
jgi:hypothetical protein